MQIKTTILGLTLCLWLVPLLNQAQSRYIDAEDAVYANERIEDNGRSYEWSLQSTNVKPVIDNTYSRKGNHSIKVQMKPGDRYGRSECQYTAYAKPNYSEDQWMGMSVRFDESFPVPNKWFIFAQWWQGSPMSPPIALMVRVNGESEYGVGSDAGNVPEMYIRVLKGQWDADGDGQDARDDVQPLRVGAFKTIPRGEWMDLVVNWKGGFDGYVRVWKDGAVWAEYFGQVGYSNKTKAIKGKWGVYRSGSNENLSTTIWFDQVRVGKSYEEVDPSREGTYTPPPSASDEVALQNKKSGGYLWYKNNQFSTEDLTSYQVQNWSSHKFELVNLNDGSQALKHTDTGEYLWYKNGEITLNGLTADQVQDWSSHKLFLEERSDGYAWIRHKQTGQYLYDKLADGLQFLGQPQSTWDGPKWRIEDVGASNARVVDRKEKPMVAEEGLKQGLRFYPNPTRGTLQVQFSDTEQTTQLTIYSLQGKHLLNQVVRFGGSVDVSDLSSGLYLVDLQQNGQVVREKLLINK